MQKLYHDVPQLFDGKKIGMLNDHNKMKLIFPVDFRIRVKFRYNNFLKLYFVSNKQSGIPQTKRKPNIYQSNFTSGYFSFRSLRCFVRESIRNSNDLFSVVVL